MYDDDDPLQEIMDKLHVPAAYRNLACLENGHAIFRECGGYRVWSERWYEWLHFADLTDARRFARNQPRGR